MQNNSILKSLEKYYGAKTALVQIKSAGSSNYIVFPNTSVELKPGMTDEKIIDSCQNAFKNIDLNKIQFVFHGRDQQTYYHFIRLYPNIGARSGFNLDTSKYFVEPYLTCNFMLLCMFSDTDKMRALENMFRN